MKELAVNGIPVAVSLRVLKLSRQPYFRWLKHQVTASGLVGAYRANALFDARRDDPEFGSRFLVSEAHAAREVMCERTAWRICRVNQWWSAVGKTREERQAPRPSRSRGPRERDFTADDLNELGFTETTEHWTDKGKLDLCAIKDAFAGGIVGYSMDSWTKARLAVNALVNAATRRGDVAGCIVHFDRGSQFGAGSFVHALNEHHLLGSIAQVGAVDDNASMESFFALSQKNVLDHRRWRIRDELRLAIITWIKRDLPPAPSAGSPGPFDPD